MAENIKCPRCKFNGPMNRFIHPKYPKMKDSDSKQNEYKTMLVVEYYCPKCKKWFKE